MDHGWNIYRLNELSEPAYGQIFKIEPLSGTNPVGIAFELHGCGRIQPKKYENYKLYLFHQKPNSA